MKTSTDLARLIIRNYEPQDLKALVSIDSLCFPKSIAYTEKDFRQILNSQTSSTLLAEIDSTIVGFAISLTHLKSKRTHLVTLDVAPVMQGKGVGQVLLRQIIKQASLSHVNRITLEVAENNQRAVRFYHHQGFKAVKRLKRYYADNTDALFMVKRFSIYARELPHRRV